MSDIDFSTIFTDVDTANESLTEYQPDWFDGKKVDEVRFCREFLNEHPMETVPVTRCLEAQAPGTVTRAAVTIEAGLSAAGFSITTRAWLDAYDTQRAAHHKDFIAGIWREAEAKGVSPLFLGFGRVEPEYEYALPLDGDGEACVYVLARRSGEGTDRIDCPGDLRLTASEIRDILNLNRRFRRFLLVLNVGGVVDLRPVLEAKNILYLSQLGSVTGGVLADLLRGQGI